MQLLLLAHERDGRASWARANHRLWGRKSGILLFGLGERPRQGFACGLGVTERQLRQHLRGERCRNKQRKGDRSHVLAVCLSILAQCQNVGINNRLQVCITNNTLVRGLFRVKPCCIYMLVINMNINTHTYICTHEATDRVQQPMLTCLVPSARPLK